MHIRAFENLQKSKLKLLGSEAVYLVKRTAEALTILIGKARDQIQMLMYIPALLYLLNCLCYLIKTGLSLYLPDGLFIGRLYSDLKLDQTRPHGGNEADLLLCQ